VVDKPNEHSVLDSHLNWARELLVYSWPPSFKGWQEEGTTGMAGMSQRPCCDLHDGNSGEKIR
jgi:hypothetical protein